MANKRLFKPTNNFSFLLNHRIILFRIRRSKCYHSFLFRSRCWRALFWTRNSSYCSKSTKNARRCFYFETNIYINVRVFVNVFVEFNRFRLAPSASISRVTMKAIWPGIRIQKAWRGPSKLGSSNRFWKHCWLQSLFRALLFDQNFFDHRSLESNSLWIGGQNSKAKLIIRLQTRDLKVPFPGWPFSSGKHLGLFSLTTLHGW